MKKLLIIMLLGFITSIFIFHNTKNKNVYLTIIGDSVASGEIEYGCNSITFNYYLKKSLNNNYIYDMTYTKRNLTLDYLLEYIEHNITISNRSIKQLIHNSDYIILAIGQDELSNQTLLNNFDSNSRKNFYINFSKLLMEIKKINKQGKLIIIGYYGNIRELNEVENRLENIARENKAYYISIKEKIDDTFLLMPEKKHLNYKGQELIYNEIKDLIFNA